MSPTLQPQKWNKHVDAHSKLCWLWDSNRQNCGRKKVAECIFVHIALLYKCRLNKKSLLQCYFITFFPAWVDCCIHDTYLSICLIFSQISCRSSNANRFGTSPALRRLFRSSRKDSSLICVSVKRKTPGTSPSVVFLRMLFKSSRHSTLV